MNVFVNNQNCEVQPGANLGAALEKNGILDQKGIAVAVNNSVIPKATWANKILQENDKITIIRATQGG
jgi:sulfur carrier protein